MPALSQLASQLPLWEPFLEWLGGNADQLVLFGLILPLFIAGLVGFFKAREQILREQAHLEVWNNHIRSRQETSGPGQSSPSGRSRYKPRKLLFDIIRNLYAEQYQQLGSANISKMSSSTLVRLLRDDVPHQERTLLEERLLLISSMVNDKNKVSHMPHISELHELSLERMESQSWTKLLSLTASIILICGICGTLWGVHYEIGHMNPHASLDLGLLSNCLIPSAIAVIANILLIILRNILAGQLDRHLSELNNLTLSLFIPALQPVSGVDQIYQAFDKHCNSLFGKGDDEQKRSLINLPANWPEQLLSLITEIRDIVPGLITRLFDQTEDICQVMRQLAYLFLCQKRQLGWLRALSKLLERNYQALLETTRALEASAAAQLSVLQSLHGAPELCARLIITHRVASEQLQEAKKGLSATLNTINGWKTACAILNAESDRLLLHLETHKEHASQLLGDALALGSSLSACEAGMNRVLTEHQPAILALSANINQQREVIAAAARRFDQQFEPCDPHFRDYMGQMGNVATSYRSELIVRRDQQRRILEKFLRGVPSGNERRSILRFLALLLALLLCYAAWKLWKALPAILQFLQDHGLAFYAG